MTALLLSMGLIRYIVGVRLYQSKRAYSYRQLISDRICQLGIDGQDRIPT